MLKLPMPLQVPAEDASPLITNHLNDHRMTRRSNLLAQPLP
jgi:hypothetical protein